MSRTARLGAFIILTLAILITGIFIIGNKQYLFSPTYRLQAQFATVVGLDAGAEVRIGGVHSGTVREIRLPGNPTGKITVLMDLERSTHDIVKQDSVAAIETEGLLGNEYISISFGSAAALNVKDNDTLPSAAPLVIADLMKKADGILVTSQKALDSVTVVAANLSSISSKINQGQGTVGALVNDKELYAHLDQTTIGLRDTVLHAQAGVTAFEENMEAMKHNFLVRGFYKTRGYDDSSDLVKNDIAQLPQATPQKTFTFDSKQLFEKEDTAKPKNQKSLRAAGQFLADTEFGVAVVVVASGMTGDAQKDLVLTQARAMVVRDYLVANFSFDDKQLKTLGIGKSKTATSDSGWGTVEILVYPAGSAAPATQTSGLSP
ncbi:MAG: MlaD family protein [Candidatus Acidiferrum sp.]|jgi:phospholipid/cholesterol/gamma-HCH transport system substrate-binding protein